MAKSTQYRDFAHEIHCFRCPDPLWFAFIQRVGHGRASHVIRHLLREYVDSVSEPSHSRNACQDNLGDGLQLRFD